jgi:LysM repeat protein
MGVEPVNGTQLYMKGKRNKADSVEVKSVEEAEKVVEQFVNPHSVEIEKAPPIEKELIDLPPYHVVEKGDNIYRIAEKYHVFEEDLLRWNKISALQLTLRRKIYLTEESARKALDKQPVNAPKTEEKIQPKTTTKYHTVQSGETVYRITQKYNITAEQLRTWNKLTGNNIYVGQKLKVSP